MYIIYNFDNWDLSMLYNKYFGLLLYFQGLQSLENGYLAYINENLYNSSSNSVILVGLHVSIF